VQAPRQDGDNETHTDSLPTTGEKTTSQGQDWSVRDAVGESCEELGAQPGGNIKKNKRQGSTPKKVKKKTTWNWRGWKFPPTKKALKRGYSDKGKPQG